MRPEQHPSERLDDLIERALDWIGDLILFICVLLTPWIVYEFMILPTIEYFSK